MELVIVLSAVFIVLIFIYLVSQQQMTSSQNVLRVSQARSSVTDLARASAEVYSEGAGAKRQVFVTIPEGGIPSRTGVLNESTINVGLYVGDTVTDVNERVQMRVIEGVNFPKQPGGYWVWVTAFEGYVVIGDVDWSVNPGVVAAELVPGSSTSKTLTVINYLNQSISVTLTLNWIHSNVTASLDGASTQTVTLSAHGAGSDSATVQLNLAALSGAPLGAYTGTILANASIGGSNRTVYITAQVVGAQTLPSTNVSHIIVDTFNDSGYTTPASTFDPTETIDIHGYNFTASSPVSIYIYDPGMSLVHSNTTSTNGSGDFTYYWNPGMPLTTGQYNVTANDSSKIASWLFNIAGCP